MSGPDTPRWESRALIVLFVAALAMHFASATMNWRIPFMPGHEFRQAQTAITSYYIDRQNNFSLLYETPILGKPWVGLLMELPVYEWSVVLVARATGLAHVEAARVVSLTCFYLSLPALYLLLGRLGLTWPRRLLALVLVLTCPLYIYYSRAFLMDAMEFMACAWFLLAFVRTMDTRRWPWLVLAAVAGSVAALVKGFMLAVWLLPAAGYGAWLLWRSLRPWTGWRVPLVTTAWGLATIVVPLALLRAWIAYTDPIKEQHASAWIFTASNLSLGNWGLFKFSALFSRELWGQLFTCWGQGILPPWLIGLGVAASLAVPPPWRGRALGLAGVFILAQLLFPFAYANQDYYFYSCAVFLAAGFGCMLAGALDSKLPRGIVWVLVLALPAAQLATYWNHYRGFQVLRMRGGQAFTDVLRDLTPKDSVIAVAGADWSAIIPLYSERRALMVRNGLEFDEAYLARAFADLKDEDVAAFVVQGALRTNRPLIERFARALGLDATAPTFSHPMADIYLRRLYVPGGRMRVRDTVKYPEVTVPAATGVVADAPFDIPPPVGRTAFPLVTPSPHRARFVYGLDLTSENGTPVISAHPDSDLWVRPPVGAKQVEWGFGFLPVAYEKAGDKTNGVEFILWGETPDGQRREVFRRVLEPVREPKDRGRQLEVIAYEPRPDEVLHFATRPNGNPAFDWAYWSKIAVR